MLLRPLRRWPAVHRSLPMDGAGPWRPCADWITRNPPVCSSTGKSRKPSSRPSGLSNARSRASRLRRAARTRSVSPSKSFVITSAASSSKVGRPSARRRGRSPCYGSAISKTSPSPSLRKSHPMINNVLSLAVLVTGGAGFLGSHLCDHLVADGHDDHCVDNYFSGSRRNVGHLLDHPRFELLRHDVTFPLYVEVNEIYNLACPASPIHYQHDPVQTTKTSVHGAINMLGLAKRVKAKIFQASTSEVYGDPAVHPQVESYWGHVNPIGPRSCYDEGKRCAETLFFDYHRQSGVEIKVARIFNTYGPRMHRADGRVVSNFIIQALAGEPITLYGDGNQTRS